MENIWVRAEPHPPGVAHVAPVAYPPGMEDIGRKHPAKGVQVSLSEPTIVFLTVCTEKRHPWVASAAAHALLLDAWKAADRWLVGRYVLMPDHVHLFCAPGDIETKLEQWVRFWKSHVSRHSPDPAWRWQANFWDTRLRRGENYTEKWEYVRENPVRAGLAATQDAWPYQGVIHELRW